LPICRAALWHILSVSPAPPRPELFLVAAWLDVFATLS